MQNVLQLFCLRKKSLNFEKDGFVKGQELTLLVGATVNNGDGYDM